MKYIIDLPEGNPLVFLDGKRAAIITPERHEMVVFNESHLGSIVKLTPYEDSNIIKVGDEIKRSDGEIIVVTGISATGMYEGFNKCGTVTGAYKAVKTGRHFDEVETILDKMMEDDAR